MERSQPELSVELERAALRALAAVYGDLNLTHFSGKLRRPQFVLGDAKTKLGAWHPMPRVIELGREVLTRLEWGAIVEVLKHEMAHQYVDEVLGATAEAAHGPEFRRVCQARGIDPRAAGVPSAKDDVDGGGDGDGRGHPARSRVLTTVAKLLALAESANEHEARSAMSAAHRLMLKHNLELQETQANAQYAFRHLGTPSGRNDEARRMLAAILSDFFFVEAIWVPVWRAREGKRGSVLEICGTEENLEIAAYTHDFLVRTAERLWSEYKTEKGIARNTARRPFIAGVMSGFRERLEAERTSSAEHGLVWVGDAALQSYLRVRHPRVRWQRHAAREPSEEYRAGCARGREIVLARGITSPPTEAGAPRALRGR